jgi:protein phosphatase
MFRTHIFSHIGTRENYEDNFFVCNNFLSLEQQNTLTRDNFLHTTYVCDNNIQLYAISDGMGGYNCGELASYICVSKLFKFEEDLVKCEDIHSAIIKCKDKISEINEEIFIKSSLDTNLNQMGATIVILLKFNNNIAIFNIGDSRAYKFDGHNLVQITIDNNEGQRLLSLGLLSEVELQNFKSRKSLNKYIGVNPKNTNIFTPDINIETKIAPYYFLCSDGITDILNNKQISDIFCSDTDFASKIRKIYSSALEKGNLDNMTGMIIETMEDSDV